MREIRTDSISNKVITEQIRTLLMHSHETETFDRHIPNDLSLKVSMRLVSNSGIRFPEVLHFIGFH